MKKLEIEAHICVTVTCTECGHSTDIEEYDEQCLESAIERHSGEQCPRCREGGDS